MTAPVAIDAAIEEAKTMSEAWDRGDTDAKAMFRATRKLLSALSADRRLETATRERDEARALYTETEERYCREVSAHEATKAERDEARALAFTAAAEGERLTERLAAEAGALAMIDEILALDGIECPSSDGSENAATAVHDALESLRAERDARPTLADWSALLLEIAKLEPGEEMPEIPSDLETFDPWDMLRRRTPLLLAAEAERDAAVARVEVNPNAVNCDGLPGTPHTPIAIIKGTRCPACAAVARLGEQDIDCSDCSVAETATGWTIRRCERHRAARTKVALAAKGGA